MPFLRETFENEPLSNFSEKEKVTYGRTPTGDELNSYQGSPVGSSIRSSARKFSDGNSLRRFLFIVDTEKPSDQHELHDIEYNAVSKTKIHYR